MKNLKPTSEDAKTWLLNNGYNDVAEKITRVLEIWREKNLKTRRNWWLVLAGRKGGKPISIFGIEFPILKVARQRCGFPPVKHAISRKRNEVAPEIVPQNRWIGSRKRTKKYRAGKS